MHGKGLGRAHHGGDAAEHRSMGRRRLDETTSYALHGVSALVLSSMSVTLGCGQPSREPETAAVRVSNATVVEGHSGATQGKSTTYSRKANKVKSQRNVADHTGCPKGMVRIPGGTFMMSANDVDPKKVVPAHMVKVDTFCMDETEVTWSKVYQDTEKKKGKLPAVLINWPDAVEKCKSMGEERDGQWVGKTLPTEEQWEYAARGGSEGRKYPWGDEPPGNQLCWKGAKPSKQGTGQAPDRSCPVGSYPPGAFGLKDMAGNVAEWTTGLYGDPSERLRGIRGGSWDDGPESFQGVKRKAINPYQDYYTDVGFRCVTKPYD